MDIHHLSILDIVVEPPDDRDEVIGEALQGLVGINEELLAPIFVYIFCILFALQIDECVEAKAGHGVVSTLVVSHLVHHHQPVKTNIEGLHVKLLFFSNRNEYRLVKIIADVGDVALASLELVLLSARSRFLEWNHGLVGDTRHVSPRVDPCVFGECCIGPLKVLKVAKVDEVDWQVDFGHTLDILAGDLINVRSSVL